ncbi:hypothetical protein G9A89_018852 [Geosiphon pyriformis]|nr:hypothetical protein G9A89_018852 [Geosiphon pyriformis]
MNRFQNQPHPSTSLSSLLFNQLWQPEMRVCHNCDSKSLPKLRPISNHLLANDATTNLSTTSISTSNLLTAATASLTNNISPVMVTENKSLTAIFFFELEETINPPLFSGAALEKKPITVMYTDVKVDGHFIKLILDSGSAGSIITRQFMDQLDCRVDCTASARIITANEMTKTSIGEIDDFPIEVNSIIVPIKVLVIEAIQYQPLIGTPKSSNLARIVDTHGYQPHVATSSPSLRHQHHAIKFKEKKVKPT